MLNYRNIVAQYSKIFEVVDIDFKSARRGDARETRPEVAKYNPNQWRPMMLVLDPNGKVVFESLSGFDHEHHAELLAKFISGKHYLTAVWKEWRYTQN